MVRKSRKKKRIGGISLILLVSISLVSILLLVPSVISIFSLSVSDKDTLHLAIGNKVYLNYESNYLPAIDGRFHAMQGQKIIKPGAIDFSSRQYHTIPVGSSVLYRVSFNGQIQEQIIPYSEIVSKSRCLDSSGQMTSTNCAGIHWLNSFNFIMPNHDTTITSQLGYIQNSQEIITDTVSVEIDLMDSFFSKPHPSINRERVFISIDGATRGGTFTQVSPGRTFGMSVSFDPNKDLTVEDEREFIMCGQITQEETGQLLYYIEITNPSDQFARFRMPDMETGIGDRNYFPKDTIELRDFTYDIDVGYLDGGKCITTDNVKYNIKAFYPINERFERISAFNPTNDCGMRMINPIEKTIADYGTFLECRDEKPVKFYDATAWCDSVLLPPSQATGDHFTSHAQCRRVVNYPSDVKTVYDVDIQCAEKVVDIGAESLKQFTTEQECLDFLEESSAIVSVYDITKGCESISTLNTLVDERHFTNYDLCYEELHSEDDLDEEEVGEGIIDDEGSYLSKELIGAMTLGHLLLIILIVLIISFVITMYKKK